MTTPAVTIQNAIDFCADNIAQLTFDGAVAIKTRMDAWVSAMFGAAGAFPTTKNTIEQGGQRRVIDWRGHNDIANATIEGPAAGQCGLFGCSNVIDAVVRTLCAVRDARAVNQITAGQQTLTIAAFNAQWV